MVDITCNLNIIKTFPVKSQKNRLIATLRCGTLARASELSESIDFEYALV